MKPFNLDEYLKNPSRKVVTREGNPVRIICTDVKGSSYSVLALVDKGDYEVSNLYTKKGEYNLGTECSCDLLFVPEKKEGWINLYKINSIISPGPRAYDTKEEAESAAGDKSYYIATIKIEWEE